MQVEQIDRDAAADTGLRLTKREWLEVYACFARHRQAARAEVVGEIVAELRGLHWTHRNAEPAKRIADLIEAKFGGRD